jgi:hypothetical protein
MKKSVKIIIGIIVGLIAVVAFTGWVMSMTYNNKNVKLKNKITAQQESNKANFDKMFKVIAQVAQVAEQYKETFKDVYPELIEGRYSNQKDGSLMKWVTESNPVFDVTLYTKLATAIEANRQEYFIEQQKLIDYNREQHNLLKTQPASWFLNESDTIHIIIITSSTTKKTYATGEENDIDIFAKDTVKK